MVNFKLKKATNVGSSTTTTYLGGITPGIAPPLLGGGANSNSGSGMDGGNNRAMDRFILRKAWNTNLTNTNLPNGVEVSLTPYRRVMNAGDLLNRRDFSTGGPNQVNNVRSQSLRGWKLFAGSVSDQNSDVPASSCHPKYVADSSNYTRFRREQSINKNYNDYSFGGDGKGTRRIGSCDIPWYDAAKCLAICGSDVFDDGANVPLDSACYKCLVENGLEACL